MKVLRGFTLIEMLVSVAIFSIVMVMALGALLALSTADRKAQTVKSTIDNLDFALEDMSRSIRTGSAYNCNTQTGGDCFTTGSNTFYFTANTGLITAYRLESLVNDPSNAEAACGQTAPNVGCLQRSTDLGSTWAAITAPDVVIKDLSASNSFLFYVQGTAPGTVDNRQPMVILTLSGYAVVTATQLSAFHMQTTITQRIYDQ